MELVLMAKACMSLPRNSISIDVLVHDYAHKQKSLCDNDIRIVFIYLSKAHRKRLVWRKAINQIKEYPPLTQPNSTPLST